MLTAFLILPFFFAGVLAFLVCAVVAPLRRFAFSSALWFVALLPAIFATLLLAGLWRATTEKLAVSHNRHLQFLLSLSQTKAINVILAAAAVLAIIAFASVIALAHQALIHRITLALFKLYIASVGFGIGLTLSLLIVVGTAAVEISIPHSGAVFLTITLTLALTTSILCFKNAKSFRGTYPKNLPVVTPEEFGTQG